MYPLFERRTAREMRKKNQRWRLRNTKNEGTFYEDTFKEAAFKTVFDGLTEKWDSGLRVPKNLPLVTIVLSAVNGRRALNRFMTHLCSAVSQVSFEVLVISERGKEAFAEIAASYPGLLFTKDPSVKNICSRAAGKYLFFADDQMILLPGALDELAAALTRYPEAGAVGGRIFNAETGSPAECGTVLCRNGELVREGAHGDRDDSRMNFFRECDLFSAGGFIVRKHVFKKSKYLPFTAGGSLNCTAALRRKGLTNYVMPLARILRSGKLPDPASVDAEVEKELAPLKEKALYKSAAEYGKVRKFGKPAVLYLDAEIPKADRGSGGMDVIFFVEYMLKRGHHVTFFGENTPDYVPKYTPILQRLGVECICQGKRSLEEYVKRYGESFGFAFLSRVYQAQNFDYLVRKYMPRAITIFNTVDIHFVREKLEAEIKNSDDARLRAMLLEKLELTVMSRSDAVIVISSDEKRMLQEQYGVGNCWHVPQARSVRGRRNTLENRSGIVFIGSAHPPNLDGLKYYVEEILPLLKEKNLDVDLTLTVIGEALRDEIFEDEEMAVVANCPHIRFAGFVEELGDHLDHVRLNIAPLRYGAGTKGKVASGMSYGVPCVSSRFGTEGTGMTDGENVLIARTPGEFADKMALLLTDDRLWQKVSDGGLKFLKENYAPEIVEQKMDDLWKGVINYHELQTVIWSRCTRENWEMLPVNEEDAPQPVQALRTLLHYRNAAIYYDGAGEDFSEAELCCPHLKTGKNILFEDTEYDFIVFSKPLSDDPRNFFRLSHAAQLLFDGGRIILPFSRDPWGKEFYDLLSTELKFQQIFYSPIFRCLCLNKEVPSPGNWTGG